MTESIIQKNNRGDILKNKIISAVFCVTLCLLIITFSIGLPIYFRPFYYLQINALQIPEKTGYSYETVKGAYDEVLDYLTLPNKEFGAGDLTYSQSGKSHFEDCKVLFDLNITVLLVSLLTVVVILVLKKRGVFSLSKQKGYNLWFKSGASVLTVFAVVGVLASLNFDVAFTVFHKLFFPDKENWVFDSRYDPVIEILPQQFFMNCAILILSFICILSVACIIYGIADKKKKEKQGV